MSRKLVQDITQALRLNGSTAFVDATYAPELDIDEPHSFQIKFKWDGSSNTETIWANSLSSSNRNGLVLNGAAVPKSIRWGHYNGSSYVRTASTSTNATPNTWYEVIGTSDGTTLKMWVNELPTTGTDSPLLAGTTEKFHIGAGTDLTKFFKGVIAYSRFWSRTLTDAEALRLQNQESGGSLRDGLIREYGFGEQSLTSLQDTSKKDSEGDVVKGIDGTITAATPTFDVPSRPRSLVYPYVGSFNFNNSTSNLISIPSADFPVNTPTTDHYMSIVFKTKNDVTTKQHLCGRHYQNRLYIEAKKIVWQWYDGTTNDYMEITNGATPGTEHTVVAVAEGGTRRMYLNGTLFSVDGVTALTDISSAQNFQVGLLSTTVDPANLLIKRVTAGAGALTSAQVRKMYFDKKYPDNPYFDYEVTAGKVSGNAWSGINQNGNTATISNVGLVGY